MTLVPRHDCGAERHEKRSAKSPRDPPCCAGLCGRGAAVPAERIRPRNPSGHRRQPRRFLTGPSFISGRANVPGSKSGVTRPAGTAVAVTVGK